MQNHAIARIAMAADPVDKDWIARLEGRCPCIALFQHINGYPTLLYRVTGVEMPRQRYPAACH
jgi:hypothetical protein